MDDYEEDETMGLPVQFVAITRRMHEMKLKLKELDDRRADILLELRERGHTIRTLACMVELSPTRVDQILRERKDRDAQAGESRRRDA